ncbi:MAG: hypothetical protein K0Q60_3868, partial [Microvirga sp.]|nr:hypothetical protein [Microvirga sp.]
ALQQASNAGCVPVTPARCLNLCLVQCLRNIAQGCVYELVADRLAKLFASRVALWGGERAPRAVRLLRQVYQWRSSLIPMRRAAPSAILSTSSSVMSSLIGSGPSTHGS